MSEVLTVKEFKLTHQLSDSAFKRTVAKVCEGSGLSREQLIERQGSTEWIILKPELFLAAVEARKPRVSKGSELALAEPIALSPTEVLSSYEVDDIPVLPTYRHVEKGDRVSGIDNRLQGLLSQSEQLQGNIYQELIRQAAANGDELGMITAQVTISAAERRKNEVLTDYAKKQGLNAVGEPT